MRYGIHLDDSDQSIIQKLNKIAAKKITTNFFKPSNIKLIESIVRDLVLNSIRLSKTWQSLHGNAEQDVQLDAHFGIPKSDRDDNLERLLKIWGDEIKVIPNQVQYQAQRFTMSYDFYAIEAGWGNVLQAGEGLVENNSRRAQRGEAPKIIPWLHWILVGGDSFNPEYEIQFINSPNSRSGKALMKIGGSWSIPQEFAPFDTDNNFVTRALQELANSNDLQSYLNSVLKNIATPGITSVPVNLSHINLGLI